MFLQRLGQAGKPAEVVDHRTVSVEQRVRSVRGPADAKHVVIDKSHCEPAADPETQRFEHPPKLAPALDEHDQRHAGALAAQRVRRKQQPADGSLKPGGHGDQVAPPHRDRHVHFFSGDADATCVEDIGIGKSTLSNGAVVWDFGVATQSSITAGLHLARICMANLAEISLAAPIDGLWCGPSVSVSTDQPIQACMASQYAGWQISQGNYFGMGSGPMRAAAGSEEVFDRIGFREKAERVVGVLESGQLPDELVAGYLAKACNVATDSLTLCVAPTASQAGTVQIVARSIETALHKMMELGFDLGRLVSGYGIAPLPPVAKNDLRGIGRTNDAILYGGSVMLWVDGDDDAIAQLIHRIPSNASKDFGQPFFQIFENYDRDFYKIDPHLFSPAKIQINNLASGRMFQAGEYRPDLIEASFFS